MNIFALLADVILVVHALFVGFVVAGLVLILSGVWKGWRWIRNFWFRAAHLAAIAVVVLQAWLGVLCPLTVWENALRRRAGEAGYAGSFIGHWLHRILFYQAEGWVFTVVYTLFGLLVLATWYLARPALPAWRDARGGFFRYRGPAMHVGEDPPEKLHLTALERAVLESLAAGLGEAGAALRAQADSAAVASRSHSGVGFVTKLRVPDTVAVVHARATGGTVRARHPQLGEPAEFLVQLKDGRLATIEAYCYEGMWPTDESLFRVDDTARH